MNERWRGEKGENERWRGGKGVNERCKDKRQRWDKRWREEMCILGRARQIHNDIETVKETDRKTGRKRHTVTYQPGQISLYNELVPTLIRPSLSASSASSSSRRRNWRTNTTRLYI